MRPFAACFIAIQDEFCLEESILELQFQGLRHALIVSPKTYWTTGEPQSEADYLKLEGIARRTDSELVSVRFQAGIPILIEAACRNYGAQLLWSRGFRHVLIVDADEFWSPGCLAEVDSLLDVKDVPVQLPFTPVIGVPGYPVQTAGSYGLVYAPCGYRLAWGRATPPDAVRGVHAVFHFSATRRTLEEVVGKSRRSAHYPDPLYAFERWFAEVLPGVKPGCQDVHMYTLGKNIWPLVRAWTKDELDRIPVNLHRYLGV